MLGTELGPPPEPAHLCVISAAPRGGSVVVVTKQSLLHALEKHGLVCPLAGPYMGCSSWYGRGVQLGGENGL